MKLNDFFKERRKKTGLSQAKLGFLIGSKESTIGNIETGRSAPTDQTVWKLGAALCLSKAEIFESLKLAKYHRENYQEFKIDYVIRSANKRLGIIEN